MFFNISRFIHVRWVKFSGCCACFGLPHRSRIWSTWAPDNPRGQAKRRLPRVSNSKCEPKRHHLDPQWHLRTKSDVFYAYWGCQRPVFENIFYIFYFWKFFAGELILSLEWVLFLLNYQRIRGCGIFVWVPAWP